MKILITNIEIKYAEVTTLDSSEREFLPVKKVFNYTVYIGDTELKGIYKHNYEGHEIWLPGIENYIKLELNLMS